MAKAKAPPEEKQPKKKLFDESMEGLDAQKLKRAMARKLMADKFAKGGNELVLATDLDAGLKYLTMPDLLVQAQLKRPGYAFGRVLTIIGYEGVSKSSRLYHIGGICQKAGGFFDIVSLEKAESTEHIRHYVPNLDDCTIWRARTLEEAIKLTIGIQDMYEEIDPEGLIPKVMGFDSVAGGVLEAMLEGDDEAGKKTPGGIGKIMADFVNIIKERIIKTQTLWVVINQARDKQAIGWADQMAIQYKQQIEKLTSKGGKALPFTSTYFEVLEAKGGKVKDAEKLIHGFGVKCTMIKNKLGTPDGFFAYDIKWGENFDYRENTVEVFAASGVLGMKVNAKRYACPAIGVPVGVTFDVMYEAMHRPENVEKFREALGIIPGIEFKPLQQEEAPPPAPSTEAPKPARRGRPPKGDHSAPASLPYKTDKAIEDLQKQLDEMQKPAASEFVPPPATPCDDMSKAGALP